MSEGHWGNECPKRQDQQKQKAVAGSGQPSAEKVKRAPWKKGTAPWTKKQEGRAFPSEEKKQEGRAFPSGEMKQEGRAFPSEEKKQEGRAFPSGEKKQEGRAFPSEQVTAQ